MEDPAYINRPSGTNPYEKCLNSCLDIFTLPAVEVASQMVYTTEYNPSVPIVNGSTNSITFNLGKKIYRFKKDLKI